MAQMAWALTDSVISSQPACWSCLPERLPYLVHNLWVFSANVNVNANTFSLALTSLLIILSPNHNMNLGMSLTLHFRHCNLWNLCSDHKTMEGSLISTQECVCNSTSHTVTNHQSGFQLVSKCTDFKITNLQNHKNVPLCYSTLWVIKNQMLGSEFNDRALQKRTREGGMRQDLICTENLFRVLRVFYADEFYCTVLIKTLTSLNAEKIMPQSHDPPKYLEYV